MAKLQILMDFILIDLLGLLEATFRRNQYALTVVCMLTTYVMCTPLIDKSADTAVLTYLKDIYCKGKAEWYDVVNITCSSYDFFLQMVKVKTEDFSKCLEMMYIYPYTSLPEDAAEISLLYSVEML